MMLQDFTYTRVSEHKTSMKEHKYEKFRICNFKVLVISHSTASILQEVPKLSIQNSVGDKIIFTGLSTQILPLASNDNDGQRQRAKRAKANNSSGGQMINNAPSGSELRQRFPLYNQQMPGQIPLNQQQLRVQQGHQHRQPVHFVQPQVSMDVNMQLLNQGVSTEQEALCAGPTEFSFDDFPYFLCEKPKNLLVASYFLHLKQKVQYGMPKHQGTENRVLLSGPEGTDIYQEALAIALSHHFGVRLLVLDCQKNLDALSTFWRLPPNNALRFYSVLPPLYKSSQNQVLKIGDRIIYTGLKYSTVHSNIPSSGPSFGHRGIVLEMNSTNNRLGVRFDLPINGGHALGGLCTPYHGLYCDGNEVCIDVEGGIKPMPTPSQEETENDFCAEGRLIVLVKHIDNCLMENSLGFNGISNLVSRLPDNVFVIGSHIQKENLHAMDQQLSNVFPDKITVEIAKDNDLLEQKMRQTIRDGQFVKVRENVARVQRAFAAKGLESECIETIQAINLDLTNEDAEKVAKWAIGRQLTAHQEHYSNSRLVISQDSIMYGLNNLRAAQLNNARRVGPLLIQRSQVQGIPTFDAFEKRILEDTILHRNIGVKFDDIGALENIKDSLKEVVVLPIKRPGLFRKGQLRKFCRGLLLFGPPGTGKTMLAKAVAAEAGANLFNISASIIISKWVLDFQHFVKTLFSLASKMAPSIIFIDEADSLFGGRKVMVPDAMCKIKSDFMLYWDQLHSNDTEKKIVVLAATNRPFDLDETFIQRVPRRLMVNLPDSQSRSMILKAILQKEDLTEDVDLNAIAQTTNGFSGNDLKNLCIAAAECPIREIVLKDKLKSVAAEEEEADVRALNRNDFKEGFEQVKGAATMGLAIMSNIIQWNNLYGAGHTSQGESSAIHYI